VVDLRGAFVVTDPDVGFELHASGLAAGRDSAVATGAATAEDVDGMVAALRAARASGYEWVTSPFFLELTLRTRSSAPGASSSPLELRADAGGG
jgi:hypothetical protein